MTTTKRTMRSPSLESELALPDADDVKSLASLAGSLGSIRPAEKTLLLDLAHSGSRSTTSRG